MNDLTAAIVSTMLSLATGATPGGTAQNIWTAHNGAGATWNASNIFLSQISNKSCIGLGDQSASWAPETNSHAICIGPHTLISAAHFHPAAGGVIYTEAGVAIAWTVKDAYQIPGTDIYLITTNETLTGVNPAVLLPANWAYYLHHTDDPIYAVFGTQDQELFIGRWTGNLFAAYTQISVQSPLIAPYLALFQAPRAFDSSSPYFWIVGGKLVLVASYGGGGLGTNFLWPYLVQLQARMTAQSGDTITYADMSSFGLTSDPAIYVAPPTPAPPPPLASLPTITKRIGAGGDYATIALFLADLDANYTQQGNYVMSMIGGLLAGTSVAAGDIVGNATDSSITLIPDTANVATVGALLQADSVGQSILRSAITLAAGVAPIAARGLQIGSSTSNGNISLQATSSLGPVSLESSFFRVITTTNPIVMAATSNAAVLLKDVGILANNSISGTQVMVSISSITGTSSNYTLQHVSSHVSGNPLGFCKVALGANMICNLNNTNILATSTNSTYKYFGTISLTSGAATLILSGSGIRCGVWNATAVKATGVTIIDNTTDIVQGVVSSTVFADTTLGLAIINNATTLISATSSPVATDVNGANRPQLQPWDGATVVYAGMVNAQLNILGLTLTVSSVDLVVTWSAFAGADHYVMTLNGVGSTVTSGTTITQGAFLTGSLKVHAANAAGGTMGLAQTALIVAGAAPTSRMPWMH